MSEVAGKPVCQLLLAVVPGSSFPADLVSLHWYQDLVSLQWYQDLVSQLSVSITLAACGLMLGPASGRALW